MLGKVGCFTVVAYLCDQSTYICCLVNGTAAVPCMYCFWLLRGSIWLRVVLSCLSWGAHC